MKGTARVNFKTKDGTVYKKGEFFEIIPPTKEKPWDSHIVIDIEKQLRINTTKLGRYFKEFEVISMEDLERGVNSGVCMSMTGETVEPDGWDSKGFPSMLLAMGMI